MVICNWLLLQTKILLHLLHSIQGLPKIKFCPGILCCAAQYMLSHWCWLGFVICYKHLQEWTCRREAAAQLPAHLTLSESLQDEIPLTNAQRRLPGPIHGCKLRATVLINTHLPSTRPTTWKMASLFQIRSEHISTSFDLLLCIFRLPWYSLCFVFLADQVWRSCSSFSTVLKVQIPSSSKSCKDLT